MKAAFTREKVLIDDLVGCHLGLILLSQDFVAGSCCLQSPAEAFWLHAAFALHCSSLHLRLGMCGKY